MARYRKIPVEIDAVQFTGDNVHQVRAELGAAFYLLDGPPRYTLDGKEIVAEVYDRLHDTWVGVGLNHWVIKGVQGECYPVEPDVFQNTYEEA